MAVDDVVLSHSESAANTVNRVDDASVAAGASDMEVHSCLSDTENQVSIIFLLKPAAVI